MDAVALDGIEDFRLVAGIPPRGDFDAVLLHCFDFGIEGGDVFGAPIVGELGQAKLPQHLRPFLGAALLGIVRHDPQCGDVLAVKQRPGFSRGARRACWREENECEEAKLNEGIFFHVGIF